jgi:hypothetical protein
MKTSDRKRIISNGGGSGCIGCDIIPDGNAIAADAFGES